MMSLENVNTEFQPDLSLEQWSAAISKELKGAPLHSLDLHDACGIHQPPYHKESKSLNLPSISAWYPLQTFSAIHPEANQLVLESLMGGTIALGIDFTHATSNDDWSCMQGVLVDVVSLHFTSFTLQRWSTWKEYTQKQGVDLKNTSGTLDLSLTALSSEQMKTLIDEKRTCALGWRFFSVHVSSHETLHAHPMHELAFLLRQAHEQLITLMEHGASLEEAASMISFRIEIGESYFMEMAKLRALRFMWSHVLKAYDSEGYSAIETCISARTSPYLQTRQDPYNNLLRATTQSMSAILGGAMHVEALPYDYYTGNPTAHGYRMGRNILQLLIEEGRIHEMVNAADGAYYIETLTEQLAEKSWAIFQSWDNGSMEEVRAQYHDASSAWMKSEKEHIEAGNKVIVGVNRYANQLVDLSDTKTTLRVS